MLTECPLLHVNSHLFVKFYYVYVPVFFLESMASANALMHHRRLQRVKKTSHSDRPEANNSAAGSAEVRIVPVEDSSDSGRALFQRIY